MPVPKSADNSRDRFVAFAFAAADLLIELDDGHRITFAAGSTRSLVGQAAEDMVGTPFETVVCKRDIGLIRRILEGLVEGSRIGPIRIELANTKLPMQLSAIRALDTALTQVVITRTPPRATLADRSFEGATGLLTRASFVTIAERHLEDSRVLNDSRDLTVIRVPGLEQRLVAGGAFEAAMETVGGFLRSVSVDGEAAGRLGDDMYGVIHDGRGEGIEEQLLASVGAFADTSGLAAESRSVPLDEPTLSFGESAQALAHVLRTCADDVQGEGKAASLGDALHQKYQHTLNRITDVRDMIQQRRFNLAFQPIVGLADRRLHHYEVLSRFRTQESVFELVSFVENVGLSIDLDLAVVRKALDRLERLNPNQRRPTLAVNVSPRSLEHDGFVTELLRLIGCTGALGKRLMFEVTEAAEIQDLDRMAKILARLRERGTRVSLDDFGAGASAFHYIRALKVDQVKLDGGYVRNLLVNDRDASIVKAMVGLCQSLNVKTVAEMIETEDQAQALVGIGVDLGQGYLFGRPESDLAPGARGLKAA